MANEVDYYQAFLARRRYERALIWPWLVMTAAGATMILLCVHAVFTSWLRPTERSFLNPVFGGLVVATVFALGGLATRSTKRWPGLVILVGLMPLLYSFFKRFADPRPLINSKKDLLFLTSLPAMFFTACYVCSRSTPSPPGRHEEAEWRPL